MRWQKQLKQEQQQRFMAYKIAPLCHDWLCVGLLECWQATVGIQKVGRQAGVQKCKNVWNDGKIMQNIKAEICCTAIFLAMVGICEIIQNTHIILTFVTSMAILFH